MSGDVQPRKRKDKKRKKDDLGVEEPRGTAAVLGEGDVFMHSQHEHGTGGHWCAKIIFFSLLAVLVTLIGLIILENRGLSELEAHSVESRYSGVLDGWLEDTPDDDHHDEHTLELLKQHEHEENDIEETDSAIEVEKLEKEVSDEDAVSEESPVQETEEDDKSQEALPDLPAEDSLYDADEAESVEDEEFLEDDIDEPLPVVERIVAPKGKPLPEVEDGHTTAKPADTLADEEEYERQQEELRREQAQASHVWLKLLVGAALLVATHAVVSRAVAPRDETPASEDHAIREDTPLIDRRMTLVLENPRPNESPVETVEQIVRPIIDYKQSMQNISAPAREDSEEDVEDEENLDVKDKDEVENIETTNKELFSDDDEGEEELLEEEEIEEKKSELPKQTIQSEKVVGTGSLEAEMEEDVPDDVEIIDDEHLEEELEEEEDEDEISDVDDAELLTRLEAKYGRLPDPETPQKHKDGGNSIDDDWPGEPSDKYWRQQLDEAEQELRQDWLD